jgi:REP element-mobilizing transposase RayT
MNLGWPQEARFNGNINVKVKGVGQECPTHTGNLMPSRALDRMYEYRRKLPHYQKAGRAVFITFCKGSRIPFTPEARDAIIHHCLHDNTKRYDLHAAVVMPDHVHLLLSPLRDEKGWPYSLPAILKQLKGASARSVNKLLGASGPVWQEESFDHVLRSQESFEEKLEYMRQNPVRRGLVRRPTISGSGLSNQQGSEVTRVGRTLLSDAFDLGVDVGVALAVGVAIASVGRTLLSDASDLAVNL